MAELTEQQSHLKNLLEQRAGLIAEINELNSQAAAKRELVLRSLGAIEYLQQIGVELPAPEEAEAPAAPTPAPISEDETKRKAKVTAKKVQKKTRAAGTTQLATKKPETGGLKGTGTQQGVNTGTGSGSASGGAPTTKK